MEEYRMTKKDLKRYTMIQDVISKKIKQVQAAKWLHLSDRQVRRLIRQVHQQGPAGVIHASKGKPSRHAFDPRFRQKVLDRFQSHYSDFGPSLAVEYMAQEKNPLILSHETLRTWLIQEGLHKPKKKKKIHRAWRPRKECFGELVQLDGSIHDWFEDRAPRCVLVAYIDDATSRILHAEFVSSEDTFHLFQTTKAYLAAYGRPLAFYVDRDSIYRVNRQPTVEEELQNLTPLTQFGRAMTQLDIQLLPAFSPQAKGRVERLFGTLQDRLVKALRLAGISSIKDANAFLRQVYIPQHNARFARPPAHPKNIHRPLLRDHNLDAILAFYSPRILQNDFTIQFQSMFFQLEKKQPCRLQPKMELLVEQRLDRSLFVRFQDHYLRFHKIQKRPHTPWFHKPLKPIYKPKPGTLSYARSVQIQSP